MTKRYRMEIDLYVDDVMLKAHDGEATPPPNDVNDWDLSDLFAAARHGIVEPGEGTIDRIEEIAK